MSDYTQFSRQQAKRAVCEKLNLSEEDKAKKPAAGYRYLRVVQDGQFLGSVLEIILPE